LEEVRFEVRAGVGDRKPNTAGGRSRREKDEQGEREKAETRGKKTLSEKESAEHQWGPLGAVGKKAEETDAIMTRRTSV